MSKHEQFHPDWFLGRYHPDYITNQAHWSFVEQTYAGGRGWFENNIHKYSREGKDEFADRKKRAYRFNHTREVVDLITKYVFKGVVDRDEDAPEELKAFWKRATRAGHPITALARQLSRAGSLYGQPAVVVDNTARPAEDGGPLTQADLEASGARVYAYVVAPQDILNMSFDEHGELNWILYKETVREDTDFFTTFQTFDAFRLWTRSESYLFHLRQMTDDEINARAAAAVKVSMGQKSAFKPSAEVASSSDKPNVTVDLKSQVAHNLGRVPVVLVPDRDSDSPYSAPGLVDDIAYLDRAVANYLSNLDEIIQDQTFSVLTIPAQSLSYGDDEATYERIVELGTKRIFAYDAEGGQGPDFISPDPSQAQIILAVITKIITEIYHSVGMAGERTKMDNAAGIDNSSGVAKAYDFDRMNTMLKAKADRLEWAERQIAELVMAWHGKTLAEDDKLVTYPDEFDTRNLYDEFDVANRLALLDAPEELRRHQLGQLVDKLFPALARSLRARIEKEIKDWPEDEEALMPTGPGQLRDRSKPQKDKKQGQNNKDAGQDES